MTTSPTSNFTAAVDVQQWLTSAWLKATARLDDPAPLDAKFWAGMARFWERMEVFDAVESSARRAGATGCIRGQEGCSEQQVVRCRYCVPAAPHSDDKPLVVANHTGRSKDGCLWLIEQLSF